MSGERLRTPSSARSLLSRCYEKMNGRGKPAAQNPSMVSLSRRVCILCIHGFAYFEGTCMTSGTPDELRRARSDLIIIDLMG